jgi:tubulin polyglutamylase TTLL6/13
MKPYLIEVNHSPSFTTDAPIDMNVKKHLIMDTLNLLNLSYEDKKNYLLRR